MPKYFIDLERLKYPNNGLYQFDLHLANELLKQINSDEELELYLPERAKTLIDKSVNTRFVNYYAWHKVFSPKSNADVWHITQQGSYFQPSNEQTKCLLTIHDLNFLYTTKSDKAKASLLKRVQKKVDRADHIVCISNFIKADVQKYLNVTDKPITVVYNGYSLNAYNENCIIPYRPQSEFLFTIGAIHPKKNLHVLPALLLNNNYQLIISGTGNENYKNEIVANAKKIGVEDRLIFIGNVSEDQKVWYYKTCKAFLFPSLSEGFGIPVIEAFSLGKPVFLSNRTCLPEIGSTHAYYFEDFEPEYMRKVFEENIANANDKVLVQNRINYAHTFSWQKMASNYLKLYRLLAAR
jgi:glycosyltransferase involved in cell wall biosynthesis